MRIIRLLLSFSRFSVFGISILILLVSCKKDSSRSLEDLVLLRAFQILTAPCIPSDSPPTEEKSAGFLYFRISANTASGCVFEFLEPHIVILPKTSPQGRLAVFLPGSGGTPGSVPDYLRTGADSGYHTIGLMYPNAQPINVICNSSPFSSPECFRQIREEVLTGADLSPAVSVNAENSIEGRLFSLLSYLALHRPQDGWENFIPGGEIDWSKVYLSGHSQGSGHAALQGKRKSLGRISLYSGVSDYHQGESIAAPWLGESSITASTEYFGLIHTGDTTANFSGNPNQVTDQWQSGFGMTGTLIDVDSASPPYSGSQRLVTNACAAGDDSQKHNCPIVFLDTDAWKYISYP